MHYDMEMIIYEQYNGIKQKEMHWEFTEIRASKNKNWIFLYFFFNMDISAA